MTVKYTFNQPFQSWYREFDGDVLNSALARPQVTTSYGIVALAGGALTSATPVLTERISQIDTIVTNNDSVVLPKASPGVIRYVRVNSAQSVQVYGNGTDTINGTAGNVGVSIAANKTVAFICPQLGVWFTLLSA